MKDIVEIKKFYVSTKTALNLIECWLDEHETIEIRVIPHQEDSHIIHLTRHVNEDLEL